MSFKKKMSFVLSIMMFFGLCACSNGATQKTNDESQTKQKENVLFAVCDVNGTWGYVDEKGKEVIELKYVDVAYGFSEGLAYVSPSYDENGTILDPKYGFINEKDEMVIEPKWDKVENFSQGAARVGMMDGYNYDGDIQYKWGLIDKEGKELTEIKYKEIDDFNDYGLAEVVMEIDGQRKYGFINTKGEEVVPLKYDSVSSFRGNGFSSVVADGKSGCVNVKGEEIVPLIYEMVDEFSECGLIMVRKEGKYGYVNEKGEEVIPAQYEYSRQFSENGIAAVKLNGQYSLIDKNGETITSLPETSMPFINISDFENGYADVCTGDGYSGGKHGLINESGEEIVPVKYSAIGQNISKNGLISVAMDDNTQYKYGFLNAKGEELVPLIYDGVDFDVFYKSSNLIPVSTPDTREWGFINKKGEEVIAPKFNPTIVMVDGNFILSMSIEDEENWGIEEKYGCLNENGEEIVPFEYDAMASLSNGWIIAKTEKVIINATGESGYQCVCYDENGEITLELDEKYYDIKAEE